MPPVNDNVVNAIQLTADYGTVACDNTGATSESAYETSWMGGPDCSIWYYWINATPDPVDFIVEDIIGGAGWASAGSNTAEVDAWLYPAGTSTGFEDLDTVGYGVNWATDISTGWHLGNGSMTVSVPSGQTIYLMVGNYNYDNSFFGAVTFTYTGPSPPPVPPVPPGSPYTSSGLHLITPTAAVSRTPSGIICVRMKDYVAGARGTLSVVSDSLALSGTVVKEDQGAVPPTGPDYATYAQTFYDQYQDASDTVVIPVDDLDLEPTIYYQPYYGVRTIGDTPTNCRANETWAVYLRDRAGPGIAWAFGSVGFGVAPNLANFLPRSWQPHYSMSFGYGYVDDDNAGDTIVVRAWGITGASFSIYLDTLWLVPKGANGPYDPTMWNDYDFMSLTGAYFFPTNYFNYTIELDEDNAAVPNRGKFSVRYSGDGSTSGDALLDYQTDGDNEPTAFNYNTDGTWDGSNIPVANSVADPKTDMSIVCGVEYKSAHTIEDDSFARTTSGNLGTSPHPFSWTNLRLAHTSSTIDCNGSQAVFSNIRGLNDTYHTASLALFGADQVETGYDWEDYLGTIFFLHDYIIETTVSFSNVGNDTIEAVIGTERSDGTVGASSSTDYCGCHVSLHADGSVTARLVAHHVNPGGSLDDAGRVFGGPTTIDAGPINPATTKYRVKYERRAYYYRAKVWEDGTSEPGAWTITGHEPSISALVGIPYPDRFWVDYPYDDNFAGSGGFFNLINSAEPFTGGQPMIGAQCNSTNTTPVNVAFDSFKLTYDPGSGSPTSAFLSIDKYDYIPIESTLEIPYGAIRFAEARNYYRFSGDTLGSNLKIQKDVGAPELQAGLIADVFERRWWRDLTSGGIHLSRIRFRAWQQDNV